MSTPVTLTYAPAAPGCCVRDCQDVIDLIQSSLSAALNVTFHGVLIQNNMPGPDERGNLWIETTSSNNCYFSAIKIWCENCGPGCPDSGKWVQFTFPASSITAGDPCTLLGTSEVSGTDTVGHRTLSQVIDCIDDKQIPCSKIDFGIFPNGCTNHTWQITITANQDAVDAGRIEFDVTWTSATCGVGRKFVTESPIVIGNNYTIDVCMPSDAASITVSNLKGVAVGGWTDTTVNCTPPGCLTDFLPEVSKSDYYTIPTTPGSAGQITFAHGLSGRPDEVSIWFRCTSADANYSVGDEVPYHAVKEKDGNEYYGYKTDATNLYFFVSDQPSTDNCIIDYSTGNEDEDFDNTKWEVRFVCKYDPS